MNRQTIEITEEMLSEDVRARFAEKVERLDTGCLRWIGATSTQGYGRFRVSGMLLLAHRVSYAIEHGSLLAEGVLDHLCRNSWCVEPTHLEHVSSPENTARGINHMAEHIRRVQLTGTCVRGHELTAETWRRLGGKMRCVVCDKARSAEWESRPDVRARRSARMKEYRERKKSEARGSATQ